MVATTGAVPAFAAVKEGRLPLPEAASPMEILLLLHVKVVVPTVPGVEKEMPGWLAPLQVTWLEAGLTWPWGLT